MSEDMFNPDGTVTVCTMVEYSRRIPLYEYEISNVLSFLTPEEQQKVKKYIVRITKGCITFRKYRKATLKALKEQDIKMNA